MERSDRMWSTGEGNGKPLQYSCLVRRGGCEEIALVQDKEQRLRFAGAAMKRYPTSKVRRNPSKTVGVARGHQRADTLKP